VPQSALDKKLQGVEMNAFRRMLAVVLWLACALAQAGPVADFAAVPPADQAALAQAVQAMCGKRVVLLGEASHGDGHGDQAKVALVQALVTRCGFTGVLFEASVYEFMPVARDARQRRPIEPRHIARAVGGLWNQDEEVQPLFQFLADHINRGRLHVGGLDFQAGGMGQPYSNEGLMAELAQLLPAEQGAPCQALFKSHLMDTTPPEGLDEAGRRQAL
jgi:erythromycin esterase-like protein